MPLPDNARIALDKYIQYRFVSPPRVQLAHATLPWQFTRDRSAASFGADWLVHTLAGAPDATTVRATLAVLGCELTIK